MVDQVRLDLTVIVDTQRIERATLKLKVKRSRSWNKNKRIIFIFRTIAHESLVEYLQDGLLIVILIMLKGVLKGNI